MTNEELKSRLLHALENINKEALEQSNCHTGQGTQCGLEFAAYEIECAMDKRKRVNMGKYKT